MRLTLRLEVADTPELHARGLANRSTLDGIDGMLFLYEGEQRNPFTNQRTYLPLDVSFLDSSGRIFETTAMRTIEESSGVPLLYPPSASYYAVLETPRDALAGLRVPRGARLEISRIHRRRFALGRLVW